MYLGAFFADLAKQGKAEVSLSNSVDCHDLQASLAMTEKGADSAILSDSQNLKIPQFC
ncbi:hypothetical protein ACWIUD_06060 [Helicobacter sp. 23-1044]